MTRQTLTALSVCCLALLAAQGCKDDTPKKPKAAGGTSNAGGTTGSTDGGSKSGGGATGNTSASGDQSGGGSSSTGVPASCGNGKRDDGEECDDGNLVSGDGCSYRCTNSCETCERDFCPNETPFTVHPWYSYAYTMDGDAAAGPKKGTPRSELVQSLMQCVYESKCTIVFNNEEPIASQISLRECFCKNAPAGTEPATYPDICKNDATREDGPCIDQMLAAAETDSVDTMLSKLTNLNVAIGRVFSLLQHCDARVCGGECLPNETGLKPTNHPTPPSGAAGAGGAPEQEPEPAAGGAPQDP